MNAALKRIAVALGLVSCMVTAHAGQNCEAGALKPAQVLQGLELA